MAQEDITKIENRKSKIGDDANRGAFSRRLTFPSACGLIRVPAAADDGRVAQLGERIVRNDEVVGSIPIASTIRRVPGRPISLPPPTPDVLQSREPESAGESLGRSRGL
jgi:hypothetical protein